MNRNGATFTGDGPPQPIPCKCTTHCLFFGYPGAPPFPGVLCRSRAHSNTIPEDEPTALANSGPRERRQSSRPPFPWVGLVLIVALGVPAILAARSCARAPYAALALERADLADACERLGRNIDGLREFDRRGELDAVSHDRLQRRVRVFNATCGMR